MDSLVRRLAAEEEGAVLVEYVLLATLIAVVCAGSVNLLGQAVRDKYDLVASKMP